MLKVEVLVSFSRTPSAFNASSTLFIRLEFDVSAACAVLLVVSTPKETVTLSGFVWFDAEPDTNSVLFVMSVWALTLEKSYSIAVRTATERITIVAVTIVCIDKRGILLEQIYACERVLRYTIDRID